MKKHGFTLIELLSVIIILAIISVIAYPKVADVIALSKISAYNSAKGNIIESARLKYIADVNNPKIVEYTIDDLITSGYLSKDTKNPLTNKDYENTKVLVTNDNGDISFKYVEGNTLYDEISALNDKSGVYKQDNDYIFKGINNNNYVSFNKEIYRILKVDEMRNVYLLKDEINKIVNKNELDEYIMSYYNDNYSEKIKRNILMIDILGYDDYKNSFINDNSYITNNNNIWVRKGNDVRSLSYITEEMTNDNKANIRMVLKLKSNISVIKGDGSQLNPYVLTESQIN